MKKIPYLSIFQAIIVIIGLSYSAMAQFSTSARWISTNTESKKPNQWICFRKQFNVPKSSSYAIAKIAVDSKYWLWVNGQMVVFEGGLKRGPNPNDTYYDEINIAQYLKNGDNTIAILVWYFGKDGFNHKSSGKAGLLFDLSLGLQTSLVSNATWLAKVHPAFGETPAPHPNFRMPESNVSFDANLQLPLWYTSQYDDSKWNAATELAYAGESPWNKLIARPIPQWYNAGLKNYPNTISYITHKANPTLPFTAQGDTIAMALPKNLTVTPYFKIDAPAGLKIDIRTDNYLGGSAPNIRTEYITTKGIQEFESYAYFNGHDVKYFFPKGVKVLALKYRETRYNAETVGDFSCNDPFYNTLKEKALNTLTLNVRDVISDCPDRERAQWWGDVVINEGEIFYYWDVMGHRSLKKAIRELVHWQKPDGVLFSPIPAGNWDKELPGQMLTSIGEYGFWNYFKYTGDTALIKEVYPHVKKYLALWHTKQDGLVEHRTGGWMWHDWGDNLDIPLLDNAWYYLALKGLSKMAHLTHNEQDMAEYEYKMQELKEAFNTIFWQGTFYKSPDYQGITDDRGNGLAVVAGLADADKFPAIQQFLSHEMHASPYMEKYILEAFFMMADAQGGLTRMKKRYTEMVNSPLTTLWEGWAVNSHLYGGGTYNHGWTGGPITLLSQYVAGISPLSDGFQSFRIQPQLGSLSSVQCKVPTPKGIIKLNITYNNQQLNLMAEIPENMTGIISIPIIADIYKKIVCNGQTIFHNTKYIPSLAYIDLVPGNEHYLNFEVSKGGKYTFVAE